MPISRESLHVTRFALGDGRETPVTDMLAAAAGALFHDTEDGRAGTPFADPTLRERCLRFVLLAFEARIAELPPPHTLSARLTAALAENRSHEVEAVAHAVLALEHRALRHAMQDVHAWDTNS